ncbi:TRAP transporter permease [Paracoccus saliphilus]|uniref:TRAP transporter fused permease subunit n=1 Tax=Paracoccus saliphilus TaxID=405559 RepID=A0AA45W233_9RHOB|nr:TRAP transporter fused permease subunit [Paracoccus saliphilus]WCR01810.1 TRAP transporter fused permease subunit [Paracoccus saliphilus]SIS63675.1 TRAP transporter, 4TM/12TM fusion protein [Paracoccus saliphilus]
MSQTEPKPANPSPTPAAPLPRLSGAASLAVYILGIAGLVLAVNQVFLLNLFGFQPLGNSYLYYLIGIFLAIAFLSLPARPSQSHRVQWFDWILSAIALTACGFLGLHGIDIIQKGWEFSAPLSVNIAAGAVLIITLEGVRRGGGPLLLATALLFGAYPLFADYMPGFLWGTSFSLPETIRVHVLGVESIIGIPMQVVAELVIGFVIFGSVLTATKGADFFMDLAAALLGRSRGGPAKVAVLGSGILGSLSGSVISNILTSGPFSIPTMKRVGYPATYAAAIESCASTGATLMPPVMGTVAFIMASFLGVPYAQVVAAAFLPAVLFYVALLFQVDMFAARKGLKGLPASEIPPLRGVLLRGWPYLLCLAVLIYVLMGLRLETYSPYAASVVLLLATALRKETRLNWERAKRLLTDTACNIAALVAILAGIGLVVGGLSYTGVAGAFSRELLLYAGGSVPLMLIAGAITSFVLGMGMTVSACYIFLSILLAPALIEAGLNPLASHLFILYWGMLSYITPPVALASITAASIAGSNPMRTGVYSMRLGGALFLLPFIFVYDTGLVFVGSLPDIASSFLIAALALWALTSALEGYLYGIGPAGPLSRVLMGAAGLLAIVPEFYSDLVGLGLILGVYGANLIFLRNEKRTSS